MGTPSYIMPIMGKGYTPTDAVTIAWLAQLTTSFGSNPSSAYIQALDTMIIGMRADGDLTKLDRFCIFAQEVQGYSRVSIVNPGTTQLVEVNTPAWIANSGYQGGGLVYLNTKYTPSVNGVNFTLNDGSLGAYVSVGGGIENSVLVGAVDFGSTRASFFYPRFTGNLFLAGINKDGGSLSAANTTGLGMLAVHRTASNLTTAYRAGVSLGTSATVSTSLTNEEIYVLAINNNGVAESWNSYRVAMYFAGAGSISAANFYSRFQTFATSIGFAV